MARIIWAEPALADLNEIAEFIALDNLPAARRLVQRVFSGVERLKRFPESGRTLPELEHSPYREIIVGPCRVIYRSDERTDQLFVLHGMRGERQLRAYLLDSRAETRS